MNLNVKSMNYAHLMWMQHKVGRYSEALSSTSIGPMLPELEGMAGFIEIKEVVFVIKDLEKFTNLYLDWYKLTAENRHNYILALAKERNVH